MLNSNKRRLYLAFFHRKPTEANPVPFHSAFLVTPKNPNTSSARSDGHLFHVLSGLDPNQHATTTTQMYLSSSCASHPHMLAGLMLLGKLPPSISTTALDEIFEKVPRPKSAAEQPDWRSERWIWEALSVSAHHQLMRFSFVMPRSF